MDITEFIFMSAQLVVTAAAAGTIYSFMRQKKIDSLQNLWKEVCKIEHKVIRAFEPFYTYNKNIINREMLNNIIDHSNNLILLLNYIEFFEIDGNLKDSIKPLRSFVSKLCDIAGSHLINVSYRAANDPMFDVKKTMAAGIAIEKMLSKNEFYSVIEKIKQAIKREKGIVYTDKYKWYPTM